jgi:hypothetical protein
MKFISMRLILFVEVSIKNHSLNQYSAAATHSEIQLRNAMKQKTLLA